MIKNSTNGVAIVTGGRRGIGAAIASALAHEGFDIALNDIVEDEDSDRLIAELKDIGVKANFVAGDISDLKCHSALIERAGSLGKITCLANNAGINMPVRGDMLDTSAEVFDRLLGVNLRGPFFLSLAVARHMLETAEKTAHRSIIFISSANATMVSPEKGVYCLSKAGLAMAAKLFAARLGEAGVDVFEVQPGLIRTKMNQAVWESYGKLIDAGASLTRRWGEAQDVGKVVAALATGAMPFCTGATVPVGGGLHVHRL